MSERSTSELRPAPVLETSDDVPSELVDGCFNNIILPSCTLLTQGMTQDCRLQEYKQFFCGSSKCERGSPTKTIPTAESIQFRERERNVLFNDALNTFYLRLYGVRHMVKDHSDSEKGNPLPPHRLLLSINIKGYFICTIP